MSPYKYIESECKPDVCPTCGGGLILETGKENPVYVCAECGQPIFSPTENGEMLENASKIFVHFRLQFSLAPYPEVHIHVAFNKETREVAVYGDFSECFNDKTEESPISERIIRRVLAPKSLEDFFSTEEKISDTMVLDGFSYAMTITDGTRKRTIEADDSNAMLYKQFVPFVNYAKKFYEENRLDFFVRSKNLSE